MKYIKEYQNANINNGAFSPVDADAVSGKDRLNVDSPEGLHRINTFLAYFFRTPTTSPHNEVAQLKARLNHLRLDFDFDNRKVLNPVENYKLTKGMVFGVTPTTDLSVGFDTGKDLPTYNLEIRSVPTENGFKMFGKVSHPESFSSMSESIKREKRINTIKEASESSKANKISDKTSSKKKARILDYIRKITK